MTTTKDRSTLLPNLEEPTAVEAVFEFLSHDRKPGESIHLSRAAASDEDHFIELPGDVADLMAAVIGSLKAGQGVTVVPHNKRVTTQEAAEVLGVSRPTLVRMLERNELPYEKVGKHRRILFSDVLKYSSARRDAIQEFLAATTDDEDELGSPEDISAALREARQQLAAQARRARQG